MKYGVYFLPVWGFRDEDNELGEYVAEVDSGIVPIYPNTQTIMDGSINLDASEFTDYEEASWLYDDTIDLRWFWFDSEDEAKSHQNYIVSHFNNPLPWESFVKVQ